MEIEKLKKQNEKLLEMLEEYKAEIQNKSNIIEEYNNIGSPEEIRRTMAESVNLISDYRNFGDVEQVKSKLESLRQYESIGSVEDILKGISYLEAYTNLGSVEKFVKLMSENNVYEEFSSIEQVSLFNELKKTIENMKISEEGSEATLDQKIDHAIKILEVANTHEASGEDLEKSIQAVIEFSNNGEYSIREVKESMTLLGEYKNYGSLDEMEQTHKFLESLVESGFTNESMDVLNQYKNYGSLDDLNSVKETLEKLTSLGSIEEIEQAVAYTKDQYRKIVENKKIEIAKSYNLTEKAIDTLYEQFTGDFEKIVEHIELFRPAQGSKNEKVKIQLVPEQVVESVETDEQKSAQENIKKENLHNFFKLVK